MEQFLYFFRNYGLWVGIIAFAGVVLLGVLKYCKVFDKLEESQRHYLYIGTSLAFSIIGTAVYLLIVKAFDWEYLFTVASAMFALNQTFYAVFKVTPINKLGTKVLDWVVKIFKTYVLKKDVKIEGIEDAEDTEE